MGCALTAAIFIAVSIFSYLTTAGIIYLIALCFDIAFTWPLATGIWLILFLLGGVFGSKK